MKIVKISHGLIWFNTDLHVEVNASIFFTTFSGPPCEKKMYSPFSWLIITDQLVTVSFDFNSPSIVGEPWASVTHRVVNRV